MEQEIKPNENPIQPNPLLTFLEKVLEFLKNHFKWVVISGIVILIISLVYIIGAFLSDPEDLAAEFEQAVRSGDVEALAGLVSSDDENLTIDEKRLKQFIDYTKENPDYLNNLLLAMRAQAAYYQGKFEKILRMHQTTFWHTGIITLKKKTILCFMIHTPSKSVPTISILKPMNRMPLSKWTANRYSKPPLQIWIIHTAR